MKSKFLKFMKLEFSRAYACCPKERWDIFIINEFDERDRGCAIDFTNRLIDNKYIAIDHRSNGEYVVITPWGYEMTERGILEV